MVMCLTNSKNHPLTFMSNNIPHTMAQKFFKKHDFDCFSQQIKCQHVTDEEWKTNIFWVQLNSKLE